MQQMTQYVSTRGGINPVNFSNTVLMGQASDGGLIVPRELSSFSSNELAMMVGLPFHHVACLVLKKLGLDIPHRDIWDMTRAVFNPFVFQNVSEGDNPIDIVPVKKIGAERYLVRLSNGPTLAFKDIGLQLLGNLFEYLLKGGQSTLNILGATSGDTGTATIYAMLNKKGIRVFMISPLYGMSSFQQGHMRGVDDPMIHNIAINGSFDDGQRPVKAIFNDLEFKEKYHLGAVNSINWARIAAQVIYYVWAYVQVEGGNGNQVDFAVPTGNFGDIFAGDMARKLVPSIRRLILATNENDVLHQFYTTGIYRPRAETIITTSPSMDITEASNFERYIYYLLREDSDHVRKLWDTLEVKGSINLIRYMPEILATNIVSESVSTKQCHSAIAHIYDSQRIIIDTHTAVAMQAAFVHQRRDGVPMLVLETAQPCKFDETIIKVLGRPAPRPQTFVDIEDRIQKFTVLPTDPEEIKSFIASKV